MDLQTFFENFDTIAEAPGGIDRLRSLILDLAVRGKLVTQNRNDESARALLNEISDAHLDSKNKRRKPSKLIPLSDVEKPFPLPKQWCWCRFSDIGHLGRGRSKHRPRNDPSLYEGGKVPLVQTGDVARANGFIKTYTALYNEKGVLQSFLWKKGTLCITIAANIADTAILDFDACFPDSIVGFIPTQPIEDSRYFSFFMKTLKSHLEQFAPSTAQKNINLAILDEVLIPLPPLGEQQRIVAKVDELMALCDRLQAAQEKRDRDRQKLRASALNALMNAPTDEALDQSWAFVRDRWDDLNQQPEDLENYRQTVLHLAVRGRLGCSNQKDESASDLIKKVKQEKERLIQEKKIKKQTKVSDISSDEMSYPIPENWEWAKLADICELITDGTHQTPKYKSDGRMFISAKNVKPFRFMPEEHKYVSEEDYQGYIKNRKPEYEDILLTRVGAGIGEATVIDQRLEFAIYVSVGLIKPIKNCIYPHYLVIWLNSPAGRTYSSKNTYGKGVSQGNLNLGLIREFVVSIPPLTEQKRIVDKVNKLISQCDRLETSLRQSQEKASALASAATANLEI